MSRAYNVDGPVVVSVGTGSGSPKALEVLGVSEDGVNWALNIYSDAVMADSGGLRVPVDLQRMGADAVIRMRMTDYDETVLSKIRALALGNTTEGVLGAPGSLIGSGGDAYRLVLSSAVQPWRFTTVTLRNPNSLKMGTKHRLPDLEFYSWPYLAAGSNTQAGAVLFDHTAA